MSPGPPPCGPGRRYRGSSWIDRRSSGSWLIDSAGPGSGRVNRWCDRESIEVICWHCQKAARGSCRFCGRGLCEDHALEHPYLIEMFRDRESRDMKAIVTEDALYCGVCTP